MTEVEDVKEESGKIRLLLICLKNRRLVPCSVQLYSSV